MTQYQRAVHAAEAGVEFQDMIDPRGCARFFHQVRRETFGDVV
jgi:hypothetical protein